MKIQNSSNNSPIPPSAASEATPRVRKTIIGNPSRLSWWKIPGQYEKGCISEVDLEKAHQDYIQQIDNDRNALIGELLEDFFGW